MRPACTATTHASGRAGGRLNDLTVKRESESEDGVDERCAPLPVALKQAMRCRARHEALVRPRRVRGRQSGRELSAESHPAVLAHSADVVLLQ